MTNLYDDIVEDLVIAGKGSPEDLEKIVGPAFERAIVHAPDCATVQGKMIVRVTFVATVLAVLKAAVDLLLDIAGDEGLADESRYKIAGACEAIEEQLASVTPKKGEQP